MSTLETLTVVRSFYDAIGRGDSAGILDALSEDVVFELPQNEHNRVIPYLGVKRGRAEVVEAFGIRGATTDVTDYELRDLVVEDDRAVGIVFTRARCRDTQAMFDIEDAHHLHVDATGKIDAWKVYFDPNTEVAAFRKGADERLLDAVSRNDAEASRRMLALGADVDARDRQSGLTALMMAAGQANVPLVSILLAAGADVFAVDTRGGASVLHKACQGRNVEVVRMLLDAGAFVDCVAPTTGHTPLMDALWFKSVDIVALLLERGATLNLSAHYGFSLMDHLDFELKVTTTDRDKLIAAADLVKQRQASDKANAQSHQLMAAVVTDDLEAVRQLIRAGADVDERYPLLNGFNDGHTALHVASRDGHTAIVAELLAAGADVNAVEPTFGAVPLHKAVYNGHAEITHLLAAFPGIDLDYQGITNGYTAIHDALWHGFAECAEILFEAGARLDLRGHDGKTPLDMAMDSLGAEHALIQKIRVRMAQA